MILLLIRCLTLLKQHVVHFSAGYHFWKNTTAYKKKGNVLLESGGWRRTNIKPKEKSTQKKLNNVIMFKANTLKVSQLYPVCLCCSTLVGLGRGKIS